MTLVDRLRALPAGRAGRLGPLVFFLVLIGFPVVFPYAIYEQGVLLLAFLLALMAVSWNIISGFAGYVSLGHSVFLGLGAYTGGLLAEKYQVNPLWFMPLGGLVAFVAATLVGMVVLRTRGHAFVIITIALLLAMQVLVNNFASLTNGSNGVNVPLPFWSSDYQNMPFYYLFLVLLLATIGVRGVGAADEVRHRPAGHPRGRGQGGRHRREHHAVQGARLRGQRGADRRRRRRLRLLPVLPQPDRRLQPADQRHDRALGPARRPRARCGARCSAASW